MFFTNSNIEKIDDNTTVFKLANGSLNVTIKRGDLSKEICDAIVNPTNTSMKPSGGLDTIIHREMGTFFSEQVQTIAEDLKENACPIGQSRIFISRTRKHPNVARYVINTVGPVYTKDTKDSAAFNLQSCYSTSFTLANAYGLTSIAYPAISCGAYHYPIDEAAKVAIESVRDYAFNVKDVRFVLFEAKVHEIFIKEWTVYAEKINELAAADGRLRLRPATPVSKESMNALKCVLCKEAKTLASGKVLCVECVQLTRLELFDKFLQRLRNQAEQSFTELQKTCNVLAPVLKYYPISYTPARKFDHSFHKRDAIAEHYVQIHCDHKFRSTMPMAVVGDGNCFYNTFVKLGGAGTTLEESGISPIELRARNVVELVLNIKEYKTKYQSLAPILDNFENYVAQEMVCDTNYVAPWDILSIPTVLNVEVICVYPRVNGKEDMNYTLLNDKTFKPLESAASASTSSSNVLTEERQVRLLFSHWNKPLNHGNKKEHWTPNHFVPLLNLR